MSAVILQFQPRYEPALVFAEECLLSPAAEYGPSKHLSWPELNSNDGVAYPSKWRDDVAPRLAFEFEVVRYILGARPIVVGSGYRSPQRNREIKDAAKNSQHLHGRALDLWTPHHVTQAELLAAVLFVARKRLVIRGIGNYGWGAHMDIRRTLRLARWSAKRMAPEVVKVAA